MNSVCLASTSPLVSSLRSEGCGKASCWEFERFSDARTEAVIGAGWCCFMADRHFSNAHNCLKRRVGEFSDAIAAHAQASSTRVKVIEAKKRPNIGKSLKQLTKSADWVVSTGITTSANIEPEIHIRGPKNASIRPGRTIRVDGKPRAVKYLIDGKPVF